MCGLVVDEDLIARASTRELPTLISKGCPICIRAHGNHEVQAISPVLDRRRALPEYAVF